MLENEVKPVILKKYAVYSKLLQDNAYLHTTQSTLVKLGLNVVSYSADLAPSFLFIWASQ